MSEALEALFDAECQRGYQESINKCMNGLGICEQKRTMRTFPRKINLDDLKHFQIPPNPRTVTLTRNLMDPTRFEFRQVFKPGVNAGASLSLARPPVRSSEGRDVMGSVENKPFLPGGMSENEDCLEKRAVTTIDWDNIELLTCPPGFDHGMTFDDVTVPVNEGDRVAQSSLILLPALNDKKSQINDELTQSNEPTIEIAMIDDLEDDELKDILGKEDTSVVTLGHVSASKLEKGKFEWAEWVDVTQPFNDFKSKVPIMAHKYPFELDIFQKQAVYRLEQGDSVFVAAHTSAGKTAVAEYAISMCKKHLTRVIYTSPLKALSNQKFRDFRETYADVGLITGDIQLKADAFCLVMTTEILRSMLYNGSEIVRELEWVVFDECHYINDTERGHVWEEILILLPKHINIILLSATVPNTMEFADWVGRIKQRKIYVISTPKRPVPLEHYLYTGTDGKTGNNRYLLLDQHGSFLNKGYHDAMTSFKERKDAKKPQYGAKGFRSTTGNPKSDRNIWITVINHLKGKEQLPVVAFTFSRRRCDENSAMLTSIDLTTEKEKGEVHHFFSKCVKRLKGTDRKLPQVLKMQDLCSRGMAVHHSGILPILKEVVEMLFQKGLVKVLFATETFAMGVNMPARTVVFDSMTKHDGRELRELNPGEYTQMAGRAGRRGLDKTGTVILLCKMEVPELAALHKMLMHKPTLLSSQFRVTYGMVLNLLHVEELRVEDMLQRSFAENSSFVDLVRRRGNLAKLREQLKILDRLKCDICNQGGILECLAAAEEIIQLQNQQEKAEIAVKSLVPGRLVLVASQTCELSPAVILRVSKSQSCHLFIPKSTQICQNSEKATSTDLIPLLDIVNDADPGQSIEIDDSQHSVTANFASSGIRRVTNKVIKVPADKVLDDWEQRQQPRFRHSSPDPVIPKLIQEIKRFVSDGGLRSEDATGSHPPRVQELKKSIRDSKCRTCPEFADHFEKVYLIQHTEQQVTKLRSGLTQETLILDPVYQSKLKVLRDLGYIDRNHMITLKGKVACGITQMELLITEMMLENVLSPLTPPEIAAALSCVTCNDKQKDSEAQALNPNLKRIQTTVEQIVERIQAVERYHSVTDETWSEKLSFKLIEVAYEWARGMPFIQIAQKTEVQEGKIVHCIQRLDEVCRTVKSAAIKVGDPTLRAKMEDTSNAIRRDIVFAASLYTI